MTRKKTRFPRGSEKPSVSADHANAVFISVYCNDIMHKGERVPLRTFDANFTMHDGARVLRWAELRSGYRSLTSDTLLPVRGFATQHLADDVHLNAAEVAKLDPASIRARVVIRCRDHNDPSVSIKVERLNDLLPKIYRRIVPMECGGVEISLMEFRAFDSVFG